jgi:hypothetical protein
MTERQDKAPEGPPPDQPVEPADDQDIDEAERESFPASDPPSTWSGAEKA